MAKKEGDWKSSLVDVVKSQVIGRMKDYFDDMAAKVENAVVVTQKKVLRAIMSSAFMLLGIIFLILGLTFYVIDVLKYERSTVYLVIGLILILISVIFAQSAKLLRY